MKSLKRIKIEEKSSGCTLKRTHILVAKYPRIPTLSLNIAKIQNVNYMIQYSNKLILIFVNIDENMRNKRKLRKNNEFIPLISHLLMALM